MACSSNICNEDYDLKDIYSDAHTQLRILLSPDDFKIITTKTQPDDLETLLNGVIKKGSGFNSKPMGRAQDVVQGLVVRLERFEDAIDMIAQSSPQIMGLSLLGPIWGGLKLVLVIAGDVFDTLNMVDLLDEVLKGLPVLDFCVEMFKDSTDQPLRVPLTNLYAEIIAFIVMAVRLFDGSNRRTIGISLDSSIHNDFKSLFVRIKTAGKEVDRIANAEHIRETRFCLAQIYNQDSIVCRSTPFIEVPLGYLSAHFTGREDELAKVEELLGGSFNNSPTLCVIYGMPGLGKTQLGLQFAKRAYERKLYKHILWISATSEETLNQGYCKVLDLFGHQDRLHPDQTVKLSAQRWLEGCDDGWLLIFDNVNGATLRFLRQDLPRQNSRGRMLFTTRTEDIAKAVAGTAGHTVELQPLKPRDATNLLLMEATLADSAAPNTAQAEELVRSVGFLPLMVSQAASLVRAHKTLDILLDMDQRQQNLQIIGWENKLTNYEATSVKTVFLRQFEELERQSLTTSHLMRVLSFLDPERIPLGILEAGAAKLLDSSPTSMAVTSQLKSIRQRFRPGLDKFRTRLSKTQTEDDPPLSSDVQSLLALILTPEQLQIAVQQLRDLSLVGYQSGHESHDTPTLRIHDVIQAAVQDLRSQAGDQQDWFQIAAQLVCSAFSLIKDPRLVECWAECEQLVLHVQSLSTWDDVRRTELSILLRTNSSVAKFLQSKGRYSEAEKVYLRVLEGREKQRGVEHLSTLSTLDNLAAVYSSQSRSSEAEKLCLRVLEGKEKQLGVKHPSTLSTLNNLASVYSSQGRYSEAETLYLRALEGRDKQLGFEHLDTLVTVNNLANTYNSQGRHSEAETLYLRVLEIREKQGVEHPGTLIAMNNFANTHSSLGWHNEAEILSLWALWCLGEQLGFEHPDTLVTVNNIALICSSQGRYTEAETLHLRALEGREKQLGIDHPSTLATVNDLALVYKSQGRYKEAETMYIRALEGRKKKLGPGHPDTLSTANDLAKCQSHSSHHAQHSGLEGNENPLSPVSPKIFLSTYVDIRRNRSTDPESWNVMPK